MGKMTVYHGSYTTVENPQIIKGKNTKILASVFIVRLSGNRLSAGQDAIIKV